MWFFILREKSDYEELSQNSDKIIYKYVLVIEKGGITLALQTYVPHSGSFRYRVKSTSTGYSDLTPSADSRVIYVSSSTGNDSNSGLSPNAPKATIMGTGGGWSLLRDDYPDWICFKCGDTFGNNATDQYWEINRRGRSAAAPQVWTSYGSGPRPIFTPYTNNNPGMKVNFDTRNIAVIGLHVLNIAGGGNNTGLLMIASGTYGFENCLFEDCIFQGFNDNINVQGVQPVANGPITYAKNITIRRCHVLDSFSPTGSSGGRSQGAFFTLVDGLTIEECIFDHNGWTNTDRSDANIYSHNIYIKSDCTSNTVVRKNIIARASSHGLQLRCGGIASDNFFLLNPIACQLGQGDPDAKSHTYGVTGSVINNVILNTCDINNSLPRGWGILCANIGMLGATISNNLIANTITTAIDGGSRAIILEANSYGDGVGYNNVTVSNNTIYAHKAGVEFKPAAVPPNTYASFTTTTGNVFENNDIQVNNAVRGGSEAATAPINGPSFASTPSTISAMILFRNNRYYWNLSSVLSQGLNRWNGNTPKTLSSWNAETNDSGSIQGASTYVDSSRTVESYNQSLGGTASATDFLTSIRSQRKGSWELNYTAEYVNAYMKAGFTRI